MSDIKELRLGTNTKIPLNGGICLNEETSISLNQSPHSGLLNMCLDNGSVLSKRFGQEYVLSGSFGSDQGISGLVEYKDSLYFIFDGYFHKLVGNSNVFIPYEHGQLSTNEANFFNYNGKLYIMEGSKYLYLDEATNTLKDVVPYIPNVTMNRKPDGSESQVNESWNMLGTGFKDTFNGDGASTVYKLSLNGLLSDTVKAKVNGTEIVEGSGITVDRANGTVTFSYAPASGTNNVEIIAYKEFNLRNNILKCNKAIEFSNRIFITGNSDLPNYYFAGGLSENNDASYFPQKYMYAIKGSDKKVTGFKVHQNKLIVFKEDLTATVEAATGLDNAASFPISFLNTEIGCDMPNTIQLINNDIVFCNSYGGVYLIASTIIPGEKSIKNLSINVNGDYSRNGILQFPKSDLVKASSVDHDFKYYLCINDKCYVLDYREGISTSEPRKNRWYYYDNINASCFVVKDNEVYYGRRDIGQLVRFTKTFNDFGVGIKAKFKTKLMDFGYSDWLKTVSDIRVTFNNAAPTPSNIKISYYNEDGNIGDNFIVPPNNMWSWSKFSWVNYNWQVRLFDKTLHDKAKIKKKVYFQLEFSNDVLNDNLSIKNIVINYKLIRKVK